MYWKLVHAAVYPSVMATWSDIARKQKEIGKLKEELSELQREYEPEPIQDYELKRPDGSTVWLSELFGDKSDLLVIHNMGRSCTYCTLWADGFIGFTRHLLNRSGFVLTSPDEPSILAEFSKSRGWNFPVASTHGSPFTQDLGYFTEDNGYWPGMSALRKQEDGTIVRTGRAIFGPGDDYCSVWPMFDLLEGGVGEWEPKYTY